MLIYLLSITERGLFLLSSSIVRCCCYRSNLAFNSSRVELLRIPLPEPLPEPNHALAAGIFRLLDDLHHALISSDAAAVFGREGTSSSDEASRKDLRDLLLSKAVYDVQPVVAEVVEVDALHELVLAEE